VDDYDKRKRRRKLRRLFLDKLINKILSKDIDNKDSLDFNLTNPLGGARRQYYSQVDRNTSNYGYSEVPEVNKG